MSIGGAEPQWEGGGGQGNTVSGERGRAGDPQHREKAPAPPLAAGTSVYLSCLLEIASQAAKTQHCCSAFWSFQYFPAQITGKQRVPNIGYGLTAVIV